MKTAFSLSLILLLLGNLTATGQNIPELREKINHIVSSKDAVVGISISGNNGRDTLSLNGVRRFPMQSVFKFHIGVAMLSEIDRGTFAIDQKITIKKKELLPGIYSPIRDAYPNGVTLTIGEILDYTIAQSDNVGCDVLLKLLGGPDEVERYFIQNGFQDIAIKINEEVMQSNWELQFQNWTTPLAATQVLHEVYENKRRLLSPSSHRFIWDTMRGTSTGAKRLRGLLPDTTVVAHKTGWSGMNADTGITAAVNNIGIVFLPDGRYYIISVFVTDSTEDLDTNERLIAEISKAAWDYFTQ